MRIAPKRIMCATDFSDISKHAVAYGIALANEFRSKLFLCHVIDLPSAPVSIYGETYLEPIDQQPRITEYVHEQLTRLVKDQPVEWEPLITIGHIADEISRMAQEKEVDLVVSATHGRSGLKRFLLGSVAERLMRTLCCPLLTVHSPEHDFISPETKEIRLERILVGCDFSPDSDLAFQHGLNFAQEFEAELHLVHVVGQDSVRKAPGRADKRQQESSAELNEKLAGMIPEDARNWCTPRTDILAGEPYVELVRYAKRHDIDMIVLGVRGLSLAETLFLGSTTDRIVRRAPCPVLCVRSTVQDQ